MGFSPRATHGMKTVAGVPKYAVIKEPGVDDASQE
jgi:hypothetical protein